MNTRPPLLLAGPTGSGKSEVALVLAQRLGGEIVSVDSMQVYRGLDIGTAKPSSAERERIPHHLVDVAGLEESFDVSRFVHLAREAVTDIQARGRLPILCGGTGLYFKAFLFGLAKAPTSDAALRTELKRLPLAELLAELAERDPKTYTRIDRQNPRRVVRAVEVARLSGRPMSELTADWRAAGQEQLTTPPPFGIARSPDDLHGRINARVDEMFRRGLVEETRGLLAAGLDQNETAMQALGYRQVVEHLRGLRPLPETVEIVKARTRQYAKRQMTWFRRQLAMRWIPAAPGTNAEATAEAVLQQYSALVEDQNSKAEF